MLGTRYEEYINFSAELPFILSSDLERTSVKRSHEANWHDNLEIQLCTKGYGWVLLDGEKITFSEGDIVIVNSNVIHYTGTEHSLKYTCLIIDNQFCIQAGIDHTSILFETHFKSEYIKNLLISLEKIYINADDACRTAKLKQIILEILINLRENHTESIDARPENKSLETVKKTINFIRQNYNRKLYLQEIAKEVLISKYSLAREFKKATKQTVVEYINSYRCKKAAEFMEYGKTVSEAARMCGFNNMSFFTKIFKQYFGVLPSKYKKNFKN